MLVHEHLQKYLHTINYRKSEKQCVKQNLYRFKINLASDYLNL